MWLPCYHFKGVKQLQQKSLRIFYLENREAADQADARHNGMAIIRFNLALRKLPDTCLMLKIPE